MTEALPVTVTKILTHVDASHHTLYAVTIVNFAY